MKYIPAEKLIAKINRKIESIENCPFQLASFGEERKSEGELIAYKYALSLITSLQQEQPEELEKKIDDWYNTMGIPVTTDALKETARHFYELARQKYEK